MATQTTASTTTGTISTPTSSESCVTATPGKYGEVPISACNSSYNAIPEFAPAIAVSVIFGILMLAHIVLGIMYKKRYTVVVITGSVWETVGFIMHSLGARDQQNSGYATAWQLLFLLAPLWINAFAYMTLARMVHLLLPDRKVIGIKSTHISKIFVWADVSTFIVQAIGGLMTTPSSGASTVKTGTHIYMIGMGLQEAAILVFVCLAVVFQRKMTASEKFGRIRSDDAEQLRGYGEESLELPVATEPYKKRWRGVLYALYATLMAISIRIIFRLVEFSAGEDPSKNPIPFHEYYAYALDAAPMMVALLLLIIWHPGRVLQGPNSDFRLVRAERKAAKQAKKAARKELKQTRKEEKILEKEGKRLEKEKKKTAKGQKDKGKYVDIELSERGD